MRIRADAFWLPKAGNAASEYEDACWPICRTEKDAETFRCAVGDGATETSFSGVWARLLVRCYCRSVITDETLATGLAPLQHFWKRRVNGKPLPWYAEEKLAAGAFSSLTGLSIRHDPADQRTWTCVAVGDSNLFHMRKGQLLKAFPLEQADDFGSRPLLISTNAASNARLGEAIRQHSGDWEAGDAFYLMTDALACWFLKCRQLPRGDPVELLRTLTNHTDFEEFIALQRRDVAADGTPMLKNDDVTLVRCAVFV